MTLTLLIDLDDTLLGNDIAIFLPYYLETLGEHLAPFADPQVLIPHLLAATRQMLENQRPDRTLQQVFEDAFYPAIGVDPNDIQPTIDSFYENVFPTLRRYTNPRPEAIQLINQTLEAGCRIAIATNPLFPRTAILQRLEWAGVSPQKNTYSVIASYETFHFAKPNPAYFAEILAQMGWPEGGVVMLGDDLENDIIASRRLGLPAFWIHSDGAAATPSPYAPTATGSLADCSMWLKSIPWESLQPDYDNPDALRAILAATPAALDTLMTGLPDSAWAARPAEDEWSLTEIICHLRDVEKEVNVPRLAKVLTEDDPFIAGQDTDPWADERLYKNQNGSTALVDFTAARLHLLDTLKSLPAEGWQRAARHAIFGPTDLKELLVIIAGHDRLHLQQIHHRLSIISQSPYTETLSP